MKAEMARPGERHDRPVAMNAVSDVTSILQELRSESVGDSQMKVTRAVGRLVDLGPPAVPVLIEQLRTGPDTVYANGPSSSGGVFRTYPRLRTVLMDALRQIGTPEAQAGLIDLAKQASLKDWQDLLIMYGGSRNPAMVSGISAAIPDLLRMIRETGVRDVLREAPFLISLTLDWVRVHELVEAAGPLVAVVKDEVMRGDALSLEPSALLAALIDLAPQQALEVLLGLAQEPGETRALQVGYGIGLVYRGRLDRLTTFYRGMLERTTPDARGRRSLFTAIPAHLVREERDLQAARELLSMVEMALSAETDLAAKSAEEWCRTALRTAIEEVGKRTR